MKIAYLPPDDILRRLPSIMDPAQRLTVDVMVYCHDIMVASIENLWRSCASFDPGQAHPIQVAGIFSEAWRIVDQVDLLRQVYSAAPGPKGPKTSEFLEQAAKARTMRNMLDHIVQRIPNIARKTGTSEALFGVVSFIRCSAATLNTASVGQVIECEMVAVARGTVPSYKGSASTNFSTDKVTTPISNLMISAGEQSVPLDRLCELHTEMMLLDSEHFAAQIAARIPSLVAETGHSEAELTAATPTIVTAGVKLAFPFGPLPPS